MPQKGLWFRMITIARAVLLDLFGEGPNTGPGAAAAAVGLDAIQQRLDGLVSELGGLSARQKQLEAQRQSAADELAALDAEIDTAAREDEDDQARVLLSKRMVKAVRQEDLERRCAELSQTIAETRASVDGLRARLVQARRQEAELSAREQNAAALENLARTRRELDRDLARLQEDFSRRDEQAAKTEDWSAALNDLEKRRRK